MNRAFSILRITLALSMAGCGTVPVCERALSSDVTRECLQADLREGDQIRIVTTDGAQHTGHYAGIDSTNALDAIRFSEVARRSGKDPQITSIALSAIETTSRGRRAPGKLFGLAFAAPIIFVLILSQSNQLGSD